MNPRPIFMFAIRQICSTLDRLRSTIRVIVLSVFVPYFCDAGWSPYLSSKCVSDARWRGNQMGFRFAETAFDEMDGKVDIFPAFCGVQDERRQPLSRGKAGIAGGPAWIGRRTRAIGKFFPCLQTGRSPQSGASPPFLRKQFEKAGTSREITGDRGTSRDEHEAPPSPRWA